MGVTMRYDDLRPRGYASGSGAPVISAAQAGHRRSAFATPVGVSHTAWYPLTEEKTFSTWVWMLAYLCPSAVQGTHYSTILRSTRSASENLILASTAARGVPCRHGNTACIPARGVGTDPTRSASLYSGAGSVSGNLGIHGPRLTGAGPHVTGTAEPNLTEFLTPPFERPATARTATSPAESSTSRRTTGSPWPYAHPDTCGRRR